MGEEDETHFVLLTGTADRNAYEVAIDFIVPEVPYKLTKYFIFFFNPKVNAEGPAATILFKVLPGLQISPLSASPGATVTIKGTGFAADDDIGLSLDGNAIEMDIKTNELGSFTAEFTIPDAIAGSHTFKADTASIFAQQLPTTSLKVVPGISLEPQLPEIGGEITVTGFGFAASSNVSIEYDGLMMANSPQTDALGNFTYAFNVPETPEAEHEIVVTDGAGNTATWGLPLEGSPPESPNTISPRGDRFGLFGSQIVAFTWTDVTDPSGVTYTVEIADNLNFFPLAAGMRKTDLTQPACIATLDPGTYYWRVKAIDGAGNESGWTLSPHAFKVGFFSVAYLIIGGIICLLVFLFIIRAFFRRIKEFY